MRDIEIYFIGGTVTVWEGLTEDTVNNMVKWMDNKDDIETFKIDFPRENKTTCVRKESILFINII